MTGRLALRLSSPWGISNSCCGCGRKFALSLRWKIRSVSRDQSCLGRYVMLGIVHIVDDDASFRTAIERRLKKAGYEVATYPSAQHLLDRLLTGRDGTENEGSSPQGYGEYASPIARRTCFPGRTSGRPGQCVR